MSSNVPQAQTQTQTRWGILGTGSIAHLFAQGLQSLSDAQLTAVGSRTLASAQKFSAQYQVPRAYGSYAELVQDPNIDVIYIATPNTLHKEHALLCLQAGKPILCEKPFALNAQEAWEVIDLAREKGLFCMEAMWMRFLPLIQQVRTLIQSGAIGEIRQLSADFGIAKPYPSDRTFQLDLAGGALLDLGVYPLHLAVMLLGAPKNVVGQATIGQTGVDEQCTLLLQYAQGALATLSASLRNTTPTEALIIGSKGQIRIHAPLYRPHQISISYFSETVSVVKTEPGPPGKLAALKQKPLVQNLYLRFGVPLLQRLRQGTSVVFEPCVGNGYQHQAAEVMSCLQAGRIQSAVMPLAQTLQVLELTDALRQQWGLRYPQEG
jgi:predicted dehydrogenase